MGLLGAKAGQGLGLFGVRLPPCSRIQLCPWYPAQLHGLHGLLIYWMLGLSSVTLLPDSSMV